MLRRHRPRHRAPRVSPSIALRTSLSPALLSLFDAVPDAVTVLDRHGRILEANAAACISLGRERDELLGLTVYDLNPDIPRDRIEQVIRDHADGAPFVHETVNLRVDGTPFPVEVHSRVFVVDGEPRVIAVARDTSQRVAAEAELRASEARYRQLLQAMDQGVLVHDVDGNVLSANPSACRILQRSEAQLRDPRTRPRNWDFIDEHGAAVDPADLPAARAAREARPIEATTLGVFDRDGERSLWITVTATPQFRDGEETPFQVITTLSDVTALKRDSDLFQRVQLLARIGGWDWEITSRRMYWTAPLYRMLDHDPQAEVQIDTLLAHVREQDRPQVEIALRDAAALGHSFDLECRVITGRGRHRWARLIGQALLREGQVFRVNGTLQDITRDKLLEETLRQQALTDPLTGLPNRDAIIERISSSLDPGQPARGPTVLHVDLDRFKVVNDLLGHQGGDTLLRAAGERLARAVREDGSVARMGGDEFLVLLPEGGRPLAQKVAERITRAFDDAFDHAGEEFSITTSVGIACYPEDGTTLQQLLQSADAAMFEAKRRGRNTWQAFNPALARQISDKLLVETQLRRALENREFHLVYQPQVALDSGSMHSVEALLRWNNRVLGPMRPDIFIPYAETTGDIVRIGAFVIREACRQLKQWRAQGLALQRVAVNVSFRQFLSEDFDEQVLAALAEHGLPGDSLELEITERVLIDDAADTLNTLRRLKAQGIVISIDDFGEGYSALNYLRRLPIDAIKISHGFMREIPASEADAVVCRSIIQIARGLGLTVIGEGVETHAQRLFLLEHGADLAQGYLFSRPVAADELVGYAPPPGLAARATTQAA